MEIFYNNEPIQIDGQPLDLQVTDNSFRYRAIMGDDSLTLYFSLLQYVDIPVGAYVMFQGQRYELMSPQNFKKNNTRDLEYTLVLDGPTASLSKYKMRDTTSQTDDKVTGRLKFSFTGKPEEHLAIVVKNLNDREDGWSIGTVLDAPEKGISYSQNTLSEALSMIAEAFGTEWDIQNKVINLHKVEYNKENPLPLSYGKGNGFKSGVSRSSENERAVEVLFVQGGERNIDPAKYGTKVLLLPKSQEIEYEGIVYVTDAEGYSVTRKTDKAAGDRKNALPKQEGSLDLSNIYPSRVGHVSQVIPVDAKKNFYDFADSSIPESLNYADYIIPGETMTVIFQTGMLAGKEFDVNYKHANRRFEIVPQIIDGVTMPGGVFMPKGPSEADGYPGDEYTVFNTYLPDTYICDNTAKVGASWEMLREAVKHLHENEVPHYSFTGELDPIWIKEHWMEVGGKITLGGYIAFSDPQFAPARQENDKEIPGVLIRITGIKDFVNNPYSPVIELSNVVSGGGVSSELNKIDSNEQLTEEQYKDSVRFTKRRISDVKETISLLENAMLGFSASVTPITVQTMHLLLGHDSLQFRFVKSKTDPIAQEHDIHFDAGTKKLVSVAGTIQHMTLGINAVSPTHKTDEYKFWDIANSSNTPVLDKPEQAYYVYLKVEKNGANGIFLPSPTAIGMDSDPAYYHLLAGILNSEAEDGTRAFMPMYGFTEISPGRITTSKIQSTNGKTYFDLDKGEIAGKIIFSSDSQTEDGQTIINGGSINANLINTNELKVEKIEATDGQIAQFNIQKSLLQGGDGTIIFKNGEVERLADLLISKDPLSISVSDTAEKSVVGVKGANLQNERVTVSAYQDIVVEHAGVLKYSAMFKESHEVFVAPGKFGNAVAIGLGQSQVLKLVQGEEDQIVDSFNVLNTETYDRDAYLPEAGNYRIVTTYRCDYSATGNSMAPSPSDTEYPVVEYSISVKIAGQSPTNRGTIVFNNSTALNEIGTNGMLSFWSPRNYFYFSKDEGFKSKSNILLSSPNGNNFIDVKDDSITIGGEGLNIEAPIGSDISNTKVRFTVPTVRENIVSGEDMKTMFGKISKYYRDLKNVAFSASYNDLSDKPTGLPANGGRADYATMDGSGNNIVATYASKKGSYSDMTVGNANIANNLKSDRNFYLSYDETNGSETPYVMLGATATDSYNGSVIKRIRPASLTVGKATASEYVDNGGNKFKFHYSSLNNPDWIYVSSTMANNEVTLKVINPANLTVGKATSANNADTVDGVHAAAVGTVEANKLASYNANKALSTNTLILPPTGGSIRWQYSAANPDINQAIIEKSAEQEIVISNKYGSGDTLKIFRVAANKADSAFSIINNGNVGIGVQPTADANKLTVQGNAKFAGEVTATAFRGTADKANRLVSFDARTTNPSNFPTQTASCYFVSRSVTGTGSTGYADVLGINGYSDSSGGWVNSLIFPKNEFRIYHSQVTFGTTSYGSPRGLAYADELPRVTYSGSAPASPRNGDIWIIPTD